MQPRVLKTIGRVAALILLAAAIIGPWSWTSDGAPPSQWCSSPNILLENGRCVRLMPWTETITFAAGVVVGLISGVAALMRGETQGFAEPHEWLMAPVFVLLALVPLLPFFSTLLLFGAGEGRARRACHLTVWGLAAALAGWVLARERGSGLGLRLWGAWLCIGVAAIALAGEVVAARIGNQA